MRHILLILILFVAAPISHAADVLDLSRFPDAVAEGARTEAMEYSPLGKGLRRGVEVEAWLEPLTAAALTGEKRGATPTHRLRARFAKVGSAAPLEEGLVAARVFYQDGRSSLTVRMLCEEGIWTADIQLPEDVETMLKLGSKLEDGKKRIYRFFYRPAGLDVEQPEQGLAPLGMPGAAEPETPVNGGAGTF